ncbi:MAG: radical SAM protein [Candidatus Sumerlaeia bacterium]|nr:radical SAM protein [Candidatus Sumerlaeia bacterium]
MSSSGYWKRGGAPRVEGRFFEAADWDTVECRLCPHLCQIAPSRTGACGVRSNRDGRLITDNYGKVADERAVDATVLPLYHYYPASRWLRIGMKGCNMRCPFCNTFSFSQLAGVRTLGRSAADLVAAAEAQGLRGISFGVNEPLVSHEFVVDVFRLARQRGLHTHIATSGTWCLDPYREIVEVTDALTFGFKGFDGGYLLGECGGHLEFAMQNLATAVRHGRHVEATLLVMDGQANWREQAGEFGKWLAGIDTEIPAVLLGIEPAFAWKGEQTSRESLFEVRDLLLGHLRSVYIHDPELGFMDTACRECGRLLVRRGLAGTILTHGAEGGCPNCGAALPFALQDVARDVAAEAQQRPDAPGAPARDVHTDDQDA